MEKMHLGSFQDALYTGLSVGLPGSSSFSADHDNSGTSNTSKNATSTVNLTRKNLTKHDRNMTRLWSDPMTSLQIRQDRPEKIRAALRSLGVDLPERVVNKVTANFEGMTLMERYIAETGG